MNFIKNRLSFAIDIPIKTAPHLILFIQLKTNNMKKIFVVISLVAFTACNNEKTAENAGSSKANVPANMHGFVPSYSASFEMDSAANTETMLALYAEWKNGDLSKSRTHFADTVLFALADGNMMMGPADTLLKNMQAYRNSFKSMDVTIEAIFGVKSTDKNEHWVTVWDHEIGKAK
jgi:hypothetical protein